MVFESFKPTPSPPLHPGLFLNQAFSGPGGPDFSLAYPRLQGCGRGAQEEGKVLHPACVGRVGRGTHQVSHWASVPLGAGPISPTCPSMVPGGGTKRRLPSPPPLLPCPNPGTWGLCSPTKAKQEGPPQPHPRPCSLSVLLCPQIPAASCHLQRLPVPWPLRPAHPLLASHPEPQTFIPCPGAVVTNHRKLGGLKQWKCILSKFWRVEVQNQGVRGLCSLWRLWEAGENPSLSLLASGGGQQCSAFLNLRLSHCSLCLHCHMAPCPLCVSVSIFPVCVCVSVSSSFFRCVRSQSCHMGSSLHRVGLLLWCTDSFVAARGHRLSCSSACGIS